MAPFETISKVVVPPSLTVTLAPSPSRIISPGPSSVILPEDVETVTAASPVAILSAAISELAYESNWEALTYFVVPLCVNLEA